VFIRSTTVGFVCLSLAACGGSSPEAAPDGTGGASAGGEASASAGGAAIASGGATAANGGVTADNGGAGGTAVGGPGGTSAIETAQTIVFTMDGFQVPPGGEYYKCQDFPNTFGGDIAIVDSKSVMTVGSHHLFVFRLSQGGFYGGTPNLGPNDTKGPLVDCPSGGVEFHPFVHGAQSPVQETTYPDGLGQAFNSDETVRIMVHYLNTTSDAITAGVTVTLKYVEASAVQNLAASVFLNSLGLKVPPGASTQSFTYQVPMDLNLLSASGHMHRRGTQFVGTAVLPDGTKKTIYTTNTWDEPVAASFTPAMTLPSGSSIQWACSYANDTGMTLGFGESANSNEMCIFTGTYYPAPGGGGIYDQDFSAGTSQ
jgi:hypothetical protein